MLGPDQVKKLNGLYPALVSHIRELLRKDHTGVGLMRVHVMVESFDSDEMARIFRELSFISSREKVALVRAAIYELMALEPSLFVSPKVAEIPLPPVASRVTAPVEKPYVPGFKLNVNRASDIHGQAPADVDGRDPKVTSTLSPHTAKAAEMLKAGDVQQADQQAKLDAAVAKLRVATQPEVVAYADEAPGAGASVIDSIVDPIAEVETSDEAPTDSHGA